MSFDAMRHAYLIISHNEPEILDILVSCLDDARNDIYIHIDRKAPFDGSCLQTVKSRLFVLKERIDARWGDFSLVDIEMKLFQEAYSNGTYAYYHLLSGVDLPVKSQDYIHTFCQTHQGLEFIGIAQHATQKELDWRSQHWFLFSRDFQSGNLFKKTARAVFARLQSLVKYRRTSSLQVKKGSQWCSVTHDFVGFLLKNTELIRKIFTHTYCPDEMFIQTLCWNSDFRSRIFNPEDEFEGCKRYIKWVNGSLQPLEASEVPDMIQSRKWFARKFSSQRMSVAKDVLKSIR